MKPTSRFHVSIDKSEYSADELEFMKAMDRYKRDNRRPFPTWSEVLEVMLSLGYRKPGRVDGSEGATISG